MQAQQIPTNYGATSMAKGNTMEGRDVGFTAVQGSLFDQQGMKEGAKP